MRHLRLIVDLWLLLPISTEVKTLFDKLQQAMTNMGKFTVKINEGAKNEETTTVVDYKNVEDKEKNHLNIVADYAFLIPTTTEVQKIFESTKLIFKDFVKYAELPSTTDPTINVDSVSIGMRYAYHICKHGPINEPCDPEVKYETVL